MTMTFDKNIYIILGACGAANDIIDGWSTFLSQNMTDTDLTYKSEQHFKIQNIHCHTL